MCSKVVIFDMDGLMVDTEPLQLEALNLVLRPYSIRLSETDWMSYVGKKPKVNISTIKELYQANFDVETILCAQQDAYQELLADKIIPMPGLMNAMNLFQKLGFKLALASSSKLGSINIILSKLDLQKVFHVVVSGDHVEHSKPNPEIFLLVARKLDVKPSHCLVLEDSAPGVNAAASAGMLCIAIPNRFTAANPFNHATLILNNLSAITENTLQDVGFLPLTE